MRVENVDLGIPNAVLVQFQNAQAIRDSFFPAGGVVPRVSFEVTPLTLSVTATQVDLEVEGQRLTYRFGAREAVRMVWPNEQGTSGALVRFHPQNPVPGAETTLQRSGDWAWLRLLDSASIRRGSASDRFEVTFTLGDMNASFEVRASSALNPFTLSDLRQFRCPAQL